MRIFVPDFRDTTKANLTPVRNAIKDSDHSGMMANLMKFRRADIALAGDDALRLVRDP